MSQVQAIDDCDLLGAADVGPAPEYDQFAELAATLCQTSGSAVTFMKGGMQWIKGGMGIDRRAIPADESFCIHTIKQRDLMEVRDATLDERFCENPLVVCGEPLRFYAGVPLIGRDGVPVGALCVIDTAPRPGGLTAEQRRALEMLAGQASLQLRLQQTVAERDATADKLREAVTDLRWAAHHDYMTGLGNRAQLRRALSDIAAGGLSAALLAIDVDHFKRINDSFGHQAGDELLKEIGRRLTASVRAHDLVIRLGGDEFAIVVRDIQGERQLDRLANRLLDAMHAPFVYEGRMLECRITIGGAHMPADTRALNDLVRYADAALYEAKARGRGRYVRFETRMLAEQSRRVDEIVRARTAIDAGLIVPFYQPKVDIVDGSILGLEALLRIIEPDGLPARPEKIAAAFEEPELAQAIGETMLTQVLTDMRAWRSAGINVGRVAVNVSAVEIGDPTFAARLLGALDRHRVPPSDLEIEIVETVLLDGRSDAVLATVRSLSDAGISIAFDDFGTGYAALAHLPKFPVNVLKIDRSFVSQLDLRANQAIVAAMLSIASELGMDVVAEGVETARQAAELLRLGCTKAQGHLYSQAIAAEAVVDLLRAQPTRRRSAPLLCFDAVRLTPQAA